MGVAIEKHLDLLITTLPDLPKDRFEVMWTYQDYEFNRLFNEKRLTIDGGTSIKRNVMLDHSGQAKFRRMFDVDTVSTAYTQKQIDVPWTQLSTQYAWDEVELLAQGTSGRGYISLLKTKVTDALWAWADLIEERGWQTPTSASDKLYPYGVPYYLNKLDSGDTAGFNGKTITFGDSSTSTICADLDAGAEPKWRNYADNYTVVDNSLLKKMRTAFMLTRFRPPRLVPNPGADDETDRVIYAGQDVNTALADLLDKKDDNNRPVDLMGGVKVKIGPTGVPFINGHPLVYIPFLDSDTSDPIYAVDWRKLRPVVRDGYWMREKKAIIAPTQHTVLVVYVDGQCCILCLNRRSLGFVMSKAA